MTLIAPINIIHATMDDCSQLRNSTICSLNKLSTLGPTGNLHGEGVKCEIFGKKAKKGAKSDRLLQIRTKLGRSASHGLKRRTRWSGGGTKSGKMTYGFGEFRPRGRVTPGWTAVQTGAPYFLGRGQAVCNVTATDVSQFTLT